MTWNVEGYIQKHFKKKSFLVALLFILILLLYLHPFSLDVAHIGYLTGTQGLEAQFHSLHWGTQDIPSDTWWSSNEHPSEPLYYKDNNPVYPSSLSFGYSMDFDPDGSSIGMPDLLASQQPFTVDTDVEPKRYIWNYKVGTKTLANGTIVDAYKQFEMYRYKLTWSINLWLSGTEWEADGKYDDTPDSHLDCKGAYQSGELWIKLEPRAFVYFLDNPDELYFAPAYIGVDDIQWIGTDKDGKQILNDPDIIKSNDIIPKAKGETLGIYYTRGGQPVNVQDKLLSFQNKTLDPEVFRSEYWIKINLVEMKAYNWYELWIHNWKYPSVNIKFFVYMFAVGSWTVYIKTGEIPSLEPHTPLMGGGGFDWSWLTNWFADPFNQLWLFFFTLVVVVIIVSIFSPGVWTVLAHGLSRRRET